MQPVSTGRPGITLIYNKNSYTTTCKGQIHNDHEILSCKIGSYQEMRFTKSFTMDDTKEELIWKTIVVSQGEENNFEL